MEIFSDPAYSNPTSKFQPGQTVYLKIESRNPGEKTAEVKLKDNQYNDISTFRLSRQDGYPYVYKVSFLAPQTAGFYSIEATIASESSQNKLVKTIQIGDQTNVDTKINIKTGVKEIKSSSTPTAGVNIVATPSSQLDETSTIPDDVVYVNNFWEQLAAWIFNLVRFIKGIF